MSLMACPSWLGHAGLGGLKYFGLPFFSREGGMVQNNEVKVLWKTGEDNF